MELLRVDPANDDQFMAWFEVLRRSEFKHDDGRGGWLTSEWRARTTRSSPTATTFYVPSRSGPSK